MDYNNDIIMKYDDRRQKRQLFYTDYNRDSVQSDSGYLRSDLNYSSIFCGAEIFHVLCSWGKTCGGDKSSLVGSRVYFNF